MADDITLTVRVRDLTRGDFERLRGRMQGLGGDVRRLSRDSNMASERAQRLGDELNGVAGRMQQLQRNGRLANSEMTWMRRTMGLLGRDLNNARRAGEITGDEFGVLRRQLDETRVGFDRLARDVERHNSVAQRAERDAQRRQQNEQRRGQLQARAMRMNEERTARLRQQLQQQGQLQARALRMEEERVRRRGQLQAQAQRMDAERTARLRQELQRQGQMQAQAQRMDEERTARMERQRQQRQNQGVTRLAGAGDDDMSSRFRSLGDRDVNRTAQGIRRLSSALSGVTGSTDRARRTVRGLNDDLQIMSRLFQDAQRNGNLSRREFNALSNGLRMASQGMRDLRRSGDLSRSTLRSVREETDLLHARLRLLSREGSRIDRVSDRFLVLQHRLRDNRDNLGRFRSALNRVGEGGLAGMRPALRGLSLLGTGLGRAREGFRNASHGMKMFMLILALLGPLAAGVGAILTTALGAAFIGLGAFALRADTQVRGAFKGMKKAIDEVLTESAQPMRDALVDGMARVTQAANNAGPALKTAFSATAPLVNDVVEAVLGLGRSAMPGVVAALRNSGPVMDGFRTAMSDLGEGVGKLFENMTKGGGAEGLRRAWMLIGSELENFLGNLGSFIARMSESESATALFIGMLRSFSGILHIVEGAFMAIDAVAGSFFGKINDWVTGMAGLSDATRDAAQSLTLASKSPKELRAELKAVNKEIADLKALPGDPSRFENTLADAQERRRAILEALKAAEEKNAGAVLKSASAYKDLLDAMQAVADLNRSYLDAQAAQQKAVLDAEKKSGKYASALKMNGDQLDLTTKKGIEAYEMLSQIAQATQESTNKAQEANAPWQQIRDNWQNGYDKIVKLADGMGLTTEQAKTLAGQILGLPPSRDIVIQARVADAKAGIDSVIAAFKEAPNKKYVEVSALTSDAMTALENFGFKVETLPDGKTKVSTATGSATSAIHTLEAMLRALDGTTAHTYTKHEINYHYTYTQAKRPGDGATFLGPSGRYADGGVVSFFASGGRMGENHVAQIAPAGSWRVWGEPETGGESYIPLAPTKRPRSRMIAEETVGRLGGQVEWFAKGGKKESAAKKRAKAEREARNDAVGELTISHFGKMAGYKNAEFSSQLGKANGLGSLVDDLNKWRSVIKKTTHGGLENSLLKKLDKAGKALIAYEKKHATITKQLDKAKESLSALKESAKAMRESVKSGVLSATNITQVASGDKPVTLSAVLSQMRQGVDKSSAFSQALKDLQSRGVSKTIIEQIAEAGISGGGLETAGALLTASDSQIQGINDMQAKIDASASAAGKTASDAMYAAGIAAAEGMVKGLEKKKKAIENAMMSIAKSMEKAIKKALGIKSPSKVMEKVGHFTAEGFAVGLEKNHKPHQAVESMIAVRPSSGPSGGSSSGGTQIIQIRIGDRTLDEIVLDSNRRTVRSRGGNVQAVFAPSRR